MYGDGRPATFLLSPRRNPLAGDVFSAVKKEREHIETSLKPDLRLGRRIRHALPSKRDPGSSISNGLVKSWPTLTRTVAPLHVRMRGALDPAGRAPVRRGGWLNRRAARRLVARRCHIFFVGVPVNSPSSFFFPIPARRRTREPVVLPCPVGRKIHRRFLLPFRVLGADNSFFKLMLRWSQRSALV